MVKGEKVNGMEEMEYKRGFTLIEMLIVIGIIATLVGVSMASFSKMMKSAEKTRAQELVSNAASALAAIYESDGIWPKKLREMGATDGKLDLDAALILAKRGNMSLSLANGKLSGNDRFGILTPWAAKVVERKGAAAALTTPVNANSTVEDHILHFAIDLNGDGIIEGANVGGESVNIRATAAVWCVGKSGGDKGQPWRYSQGLKKDDIYSWTKGQTQAVQ